MRLRATCRLAEIVAWPAAVWYPVEAALRGATGDSRGAAWALLLGALAFAMVAAARMASRAAVAPIR